MRPSNLWYKSAVVYELEVRTFYDANRRRRKPEGWQSSSNWWPTTLRSITPGSSQPPRPVTLNSVVSTYGATSPCLPTEMGDLPYMVDLFSDSAYGRPNPDAPDLTISGYGYRWLMGRLDGDHR